MSRLLIHRLRVAALAALGVSFLVSSLQGADALPKPSLSEAAELFRAGKRKEAFALVEKAIKEHPKSAQPWFVQGVFWMESQPAKAVESFTKAANFEPGHGETYQKRGEAQFMLGHFNESVADFDKLLELEPDKRPYHWQRGISCYYAKKYEEGRKQFELHRTVNPNDVENAVWHYLCVAKLSSATKARESLIPVQGDARVPMREIFSLFAGKAQPQDVLKAAGGGGGLLTAAKHQLFYAYLYLGLYYEAEGKAEEARLNILKAAADAPPDYMGAVARVHAKLFTAAAK